MWVREAFYRWLWPAAVVLPLWLLIGWGVFQAGGWAFLWVLFIAIPSVFLGQLLLTLLVRARPSARELRAVSWWDVAGFGLWHALTIAVGCFPENWFGLVLTAAILVGLGLFWLQLWQLWSEARGSGRGIRIDTWRTEMRGPEPQRTRERDVYIIEENPPADR
jgi:hypothetical protein